MPPEFGETGKQSQAPRERFARAVIVPIAPPARSRVRRQSTGRASPPREASRCTDAATGRPCQHEFLCATIIIALTLPTQSKPATILHHLQIRGIAVADTWPSDMHWMIIRAIIERRLLGVYCEPWPEQRASRLTPHLSNIGGQCERQACQLEATAHRQDRSDSHAGRTV